MTQPAQKQTRDANSSIPHWNTIRSRSFRSTAGNKFVSPLLGPSALVFDAYTGKMMGIMRAAAKAVIRKAPK